MARFARARHGLTWHGPFCQGTARPGPAQDIPVAFGSNVRCPLHCLPKSSELGPGTLHNTSNPPAGDRSEGVGMGWGGSGKNWKTLRTYMENTWKILGNTGNIPGEACPT